MTEDLIQGTEDREILEQTVLNEKIVTHPKLGKIRLLMPTLDIQRKLDAAHRAKKKELRSATDKVADPDNPGKFLEKPAYKSKDILLREYKDAGWWSNEQDTNLQELQQKQLEIVAQLELLDFESLEDLHLEKYENN